MVYGLILVSTITNSNEKICIVRIQTEKTVTIVGCGRTIKADPIHDVII
jgi:hypothetical protein